MGGGTSSKLFILLFVRESNKNWALVNFEYILVRHEECLLLVAFVCGGEARGGCETLESFPGNVENLHK